MEELLLEVEEKRVVKKRRRESGVGEGSVMVRVARDGLGLG